MWFLAKHVPFNLYLCIHFSAEIATKMLVEREGGKGLAIPKFYRVDDKNVSNLDSLKAKKKSVYFYLIVKVTQRPYTAYKTEP